MIDYLTFIEELKKIREANQLKPQSKINAMIDQTVEKYEGMIDEFEKDQENQQKLTLDNEVVS
jgi:hypothetical protein|tara:strand:- start:114 stop:302 length:189 start_codon:yes stop_codon:yes gene_type:complete